MGLAINVLEKFLPPFMRRILFYGKISGNERKKSDFMSFLFVPKSWFRHFYIFASVWCSLVVLMAIQGLSTGTVPTCFIDFLNLICGKYRTVQIFSKKATMNLIQYLNCYVYYFGVVVLLICRGEGFVTGTSLTHLSIDGFSWRLVICCALFVFASYHQFNSHRILVNLRRDKQGRVATEGHFVPSDSSSSTKRMPHECEMNNAALSKERGSDGGM
uniref:Polyprenal reductase n=2 Tax=Lutzomyia longipalpis TaxID=7200 RepID=A0A1B0GJR6_LUTLO